MPKTYWERVEELFHQAMALDPQQRQAFLYQATEQDQVLLREVESLLDYERTSPSFIEDHALLTCQFLADCELNISGDSEGGEISTARDEDAPDPLIGQTVSHFRIVEKLGSGGMGVVYKAEDLDLGRFVALKFLKRDKDSGEDRSQLLDLLYREARTCSALDHPNICTIYESGQHDGSPFIVMQLLVGRSLKEEIQRGPLPAARIAAIGMQCAAALEAAHAAGVVHRDIKPANIFITQREEIKILDFGVAKSQAPDRTAPDSIRPSNGPECLLEPTMLASAAFGTVAYMSPQQVLGEAPDARSDLFSLGVVLYEAATGALPFQGNDPAEMLDNILHQEPPSPRQLNPAIPEDLSRVLVRVLQKQPQDRYQSASDLRLDVELIKQALDANYTGSRRQGGRKRALLASATALLAVATVSFYIAHLTSEHRNSGRRDAVVLADFTNHTGEPVFDQTLNQALRVQLEQSPFLNVLSPETVAQEQQYMGTASGESLSAAAALKICRRTGSDAMLSGSIAKLGSHYVLNLNVVNCHTGQTLDAEQSDVASREAVLPALGTAAHTIRSKLGESLASVQKFDAPVEEATTPSLEALRAYGLGLTTWYAEGEKASIPFFLKATELDPRFAMAYARLGNAYFETNQLALGREAVRKAYELRDRVSERERLYIDSHYYEDVSGELDKAVPVFQLWQDTYPDDPVPYVNLGADYTSLGKHELALEQDRKALQMEPSLGLLYSNLALEYASLEDYQHASEILRQAQQRQLEYSTLIGAAYQLAFLRGDQAEMERQVHRGMGHPWTEAWLLALQADTEAYYGRRSTAEQFTRRAAESARRYDDHEAAVGYELMDALRDAEYGYPAHARTIALRALTADDGQQTLVLSALALARAGEGERAVTISRELERRFPADTLLIHYWLPTIRAAAALSNHLPSAALDALQAVVPYDLAAPKTPTTATLYPVYLRGLALLAMGNAGAAAEEFQKLLNHRGLGQNYLLGPLAELQLARAYAMLAQQKRSTHPAEHPDAANRAFQAYQSFLTSWQHADADLPVLHQARAELQELSTRTTRQAVLSH